MEDDVKKGGESSPIPSDVTPIEDKNKVDENKSSTSSSIESAIETRISQLKESIQESKVAFKKSSCKLFWQIVLLVFACFVITFKSYVFAKYLLDPAHVILHDTWKWQTIYYTAIRITVLGAIFSLATYFFKLLSSYIQMYQMIQHKIAVIDALPGFVESGSDPEKRNVILNKLIEMVVQVDETGILGKERQFKTSNDEIIKLVDLLMKLKK